MGHEVLNLVLVNLLLNEQWGESWLLDFANLFALVGVTGDSYGIIRKTTNDKKK